MATRKKEVLSAQVVLRSAAGRAPGGETAVTAENVHEYAPDDSAAEAARRAFAEAGFEVGRVVGNSFSITAPASTFKKVFKVRTTRGEDGGVTAQSSAQASAGEEAGYELPLDKLPKGLARGVAAVTFTPPPDFGPTSFY